VGDLKRRGLPASSLPGPGAVGRSSGTAGAA